MGATTRDIALTIIANGERAYYASVKGVGNLIWDIRFGLYSGVTPNARKALDFIEGTDWEGCIEPLDKPLDAPVYGSITIDFDKMEVIDANGYGSSNQMFFEWLEQSVQIALQGSDGIIPAVSLAEHFKHGRIQVLAGLEPYRESLKFDDLAVASNEITLMKERAWESERKYISFARIAMPEGWKLLSATSEG